jgi:valyl-tRNA synthetase
LISTAWPDLPQSYVDPAADAEINWLVALITEVRQVRAEMNVPPGARIPLAVIGADAEVSARLKRHGDLIRTLGRLDSIREADTPAAGSALFVVGETTGALAVADFIDVPSEKARLAKEIAALATDIDRTAKKLGNADFIARAPEDVVEENRERLAEAESAREKLAAALERLSAMA